MAQEQKPDEPLNFCGGVQGQYLVTATPIPDKEKDSSSLPVLDKLHKKPNLTLYKNDTEKQ